MEKKNLFGLCPYVTSQKVLSGKWSMYIMYLLTDGPIRFNELQRKMPEEMTHTTLSRQLKKLEEEGLIERIEYQQIPPKVEYKLKLYALLDLIFNKNINEIMALENELDLLIKEIKGKTTLFFPNSVKITQM